MTGAHSTGERFRDTMALLFVFLVCCPLSNPQDGSVDTTGTNVGSTATFACNVGFLLIGANATVCNSSGMWSEAMPICQKGKNYILLELFVLECVRDISKLKLIKLGVTLLFFA